MERAPPAYYVCGMVELRVIESGGDEEQLFQRLPKDLFAFDRQTFEGLVERFRSRLTIDDIPALLARCLRSRKVGSQSERNARLAVVEGRFDERIA